MIKYTDENIEKLELVYQYMMLASQLHNTAAKKALILDAGELMKEVGLISNTNDVQQIVTTYRAHVLERIREIVRKEQDSKSNNQIL